MTLASVLRSRAPRDNNFNLLRLSAAATVLIAHSRSMYGLGSAGAADIAVNVFFVISGFLITRSWLSKKSLKAFAWARFIRIYPALIVSSVLLVFISGVLFSPLGAEQFLRRSSTIAYIVKNSMMLPKVGAQVSLPFAIGNWHGPFNLPLWTLPNEIQMYALVALLGIIGILRSRWIVLTLTLLSFALWIYTAEDRFRLVFYFLAGSSCFLYAPFVKFDRQTTLAYSMIALLGIAVGSKYVAALAIPCLVFWAAYVPGGRLRLFNRIGDYSYGTYIFAYPIQVALFYYPGPKLGVEEHTCLAILITLLLAAASWHGLEKRALSWALPRRLVAARVAGLHWPIIRERVERRDS